MRSFREGSSTVEAAFVVSLILFLLAAVILMMFYLHDRAILFETALLHSKRICHMVEEPVSEQGKLMVDRLEAQSFLRVSNYRSYVNTAVWEARFREEAEERMFLTTLTDVTVVAADNEVEVSYSGAFRVPLGGVTRKVLRDMLMFSDEVRVTFGTSAEELVRLCRSIKRK